MTNKPVIGQLTVIEDGVPSTSNIEIWPNYGIVCHALGTSNGSAVIIAVGLESQPSRLASLRRNIPSKKWAVRVALGDRVVDMDSVGGTWTAAAIRDDLLALWRDHFAKRNLSNADCVAG
jgi:hypothetical protein